VVGEAKLVFLADLSGSERSQASSVALVDYPAASQVAIEHSAGRLEIVDRQRLEALYEISKRLLDQRETSGLIDEASGFLITVLGAERVVFGLTCDPERNPDLLIVRPLYLQDTSVMLSRSVLRRTLEAKRAILISDTGLDRDLAEAQSVAAGKIHSALCVPMMRRQDVTGFIYLDSRAAERSYLEGDLQFACAVGAMVGTAIENARLRETELIKQRMEAELASAREVQRLILPSDWPAIDGWDISGTHATCYEVGGDYYDAILAGDGRLWLLVADVAGKGAPAALLASCVHASMQTLVSSSASPARFLDRLNHLLLRRGSGQPFVTCLVAAIALKTGHVTLASAGHPHPIFVPQTGMPREVSIVGSLILGFERDIEFTETQWAFPATPGTLLLYTDGITEARNDERTLFGTDRLLATIADCAGKSAAELNAAVVHSVREFLGSQQQTDDFSLLACRRL